MSAIYNPRGHLQGFLNLHQMQSEALEVALEAADACLDKRPQLLRVSWDDAAV